MSAIPRGRAASCFGLLFLIAFIAPTIANAADILFSPDTGSHPVGEEFSIKVRLDPGDADVNAADGTVTFDSEVLTAVSVSKEGSAFSLWTAEPILSNGAGTVAFSGGTPSAFSAASNILTIVFKGKKAGSGKLSVSKGSVLAADGKGTDVFSKGGEATFTITEAASAPPEEEVADEVPSDSSVTPLAPVINSPSHGKPEQWYATSTAKFTWRNPPDVTGIRTLFSDKEDATPTKLVDVTATTETVTDIADGQWYLLVQQRNEFGWGAIGKRVILVDTTPPTEFDFTLDETGDTPMLKFKSEDAPSGIDRYEIILGSTTLATIRASDFVDGAPVPPQEGGKQTLVIKAHDKAGNFREAKKELELPKVAKPNAKGKGEDEEPSVWTLERILTILFALATGALATSNYYSRKNTTAERIRILQEVLEVRDKNDKVFAAMREEFEQMVNDFDEKPQLTPEERDFLEKIKEVLDISEELVDSGIEELKKTVRGQK